jgi:hypothetical protein
VNSSAWGKKDASQPMSAGTRAGNLAQGEAHSFSVPV